MTKMKNILGLLAVGALLSVNSSVNALTYTFPDNYKAFPGYPDNTPWGYVDEYGDPKIDSMGVTLDSTNKFLQSVVLNIRPTTGLKGENDVTIRWDSLFINTSYVDLTKATDKDSWDQSWDYFVHSGGATPVRGSASSISGDVQTANGLYKVSESFNHRTDYTIVTNTRYNHPDGIDKDLLGASPIDKNIFGVFSTQSLGNNQFGYKISYDFSSLAFGGIALGNGFTLGYTPWCANDVFLASALAPVPEPATMLLFGVGLAGLASYSLKRKRKNNR